MIKSKLVMNYVVLLMILLSGNVFFSFTFVKETRYLLYLSAICILIYGFTNLIISLAKKAS